MISLDKLTSNCFYLFCKKRTKVKERKTPYTVYLLDLYGASCQSDGLIEVKRIKNNYSFGPRKR